MKAAILALALLIPSPAVPQQSGVPVDTIARAKFPNDNPAQIDAIAAFNKAVNGALTYETDREHYGVEDHYVSLPPDGKGDCEDYALSKIELLSAIGFPTVTNSKLVFVVVHVGKDRYGHAIVAILLPSGAVAYLDMNGEPMTRSELLAKGYEFQRWEA
jgi:predicted transglutaminase-like cysteine proteinase